MRRVFTGRLVFARDGLQLLTLNKKKRLTTSSPSFIPDDCRLLLFSKNNLLGGNLFSLLSKKNNHLAGFQPISRLHNCMFRKFIHGSGKIGKDNIKSVQDACGSVKVASEASQDARGTVAAGGSLFSHHKTPVQRQDGDQERPENPKKLLSYKRSIENAIRNIEKWKANFDKLKTANENGANIAKLPAKHKMRSWVDVQRRKYWLAVNNGLVVGKRSESMYERGLSLKLQPLTQDQVDALESLGMEWDPLRANFETKFAALKEYKEQNGTLKGLYKENMSLYHWVIGQKARYLKSRNSAGLPEKEANLLRELGITMPERTPW